MFISIATIVAVIASINPAQVLGNSHDGDVSAAKLGRRHNEVSHRARGDVARRTTYEFNNIRATCEPTSLIYLRDGLLI